MAQYVTGIDFGTSNSAAAISAGTAPRMVRIDGAHDTVPTALYFPDATPQIYFGRAARDEYMFGGTDGRLMRSLKRILGTDTMNSGTVINGRRQSFYDIIGYFVGHIKSQIDVAAGMNVESVVMGRPVHFRDDDPAGDARAQNELEQIAKNVGFKNVEFQFEPIAAAFAHEQNLKSEKLAAVIDIGGGTSDFTVIRLGPDYARKSNRADDVLSNTGVRIGGNDVDYDLALRRFMPLFGMGDMYRSGDKLINIPNGPYFSLSTWSAVNEVYNPKTLNMVRGFVTFGIKPERVARLYEIIAGRFGHLNLEYVENAKIALSDRDAVDIALEFLSDMPGVQITRAEFENTIAATVERISAAAQMCVNNAGIKNSDIDMVILTGGTTEIPCVSELARRLFPTAQMSSANKMASVALGLTHDAVRRFL